MLLHFSPDISNQRFCPTEAFCDMLCMLLRFLSPYITSCDSLILTRDRPKPYSCPDYMDNPICMPRALLPGFNGSIFDGANVYRNEAIRVGVFRGAVAQSPSAHNHQGRLDVQAAHQAKNTVALLLLSRFRCVNVGPNMNHCTLIRATYWGL